MPYRTREQSLGFIEQATHMNYLNPHTGDVRKSSKSGLATTFDSSQKMTDFVTPGFKKRVAKGDIICSPLDNRKERSTQTLNYFRNHLGSLYRDPQDQSYYFGSGPTEELVSAGFTDEGVMSARTLLAGASIPSISIDPTITESLVVNEAWSKVDVNKASGLVTIAEAQKTASSVASILGRLFRILRMLKKLQFDQIKKELSAAEISDRWLEARYAVRPLVIDLEQVVKAYNLRREFDHYTSRARKIITEEKTSTGVAKNFSSFDVNYTAHRRVSFEISAGVRYKYDVVGLGERLQTFGFDDFADAAWELVPFSFIIDWFFSVGNTIAAWAPKAGVQPLCSFLTTHKTDSLSVQCTGVTPVINRYAYQDERGREVIGSGNYTDIVTTTVRQPAPGRTFVPRLDVNLDAFKLTDLLLILSKRFGQLKV